MRPEWPGFNEAGTVVIALPADSFHMAQTIDIQGTTFVAKDELHVTLIGTELGSLLQHSIKQDASIIDQLKHAFVSIDWSYQQSGTLHILSRKKNGSRQKSVIMLLNMPGVAAFYQRLQALHLIGADTPLPPAHVTLYTHNCPRGIGVPDQQSLAALSSGTLTVDSLATK